MLTLNWTDPSARALALGDVISLRPNGRGCRITCLAGRLWVTVTGSGVDTVLAAGEETIFAGGGRIVVEALRDASVRMERPVRARTARQVWSPQAAH
jgi:hypothetical protein